MLSTSLCASLLRSSIALGQIYRTSPGEDDGWFFLYACQSDSFSAYYWISRFSKIVEKSTRAFLQQSLSLSLSLSLCHTLAVRSIFCFFVAVPAEWDSWACNVSSQYSAVCSVLLLYASSNHEIRMSLAYSLLLCLHSFSFFPLSLSLSRFFFLIVVVVSFFHTSSEGKKW